MNASKKSAFLSVVSEILVDSACRHPIVERSRVATMVIITGDFFHADRFS